MLKVNFNVHYNRNYIYELLRRRGYTLKKPRPRHYKANAALASSVKRKIKKIAASGYAMLYE
ncbi:MAG: winged helix-turn-helix domain-containing protein, partial [Deltaproteobacteria bacterium]|nr:winged helix-turn-helix domain-containing protein [Deltaproteobacteria bacterium]